jgi:AraC-like DNA-binding protein
MIMLHDPLRFVHAASTPHHTLTVERTGMAYYGLQFMACGGVDLQIDTQQYALEGGWIWCTYPGSYFRYAPLAGVGYWHHRFVTFAGPRAETWVTEGLLPFPPQRVPDPEAFGERMDGIRELIERKERFSYLQAMHALEGILLDLAAARTELVERPAWLQLLLGRLRTGLSALPGYPALAEECHMSVSTLRRQFKAHMGMPIHTYLLRLRVSVAQEVLTETDLPLRLIAEQVGYRDIFFFCRQFRQLTGISPGQYRRMVQSSMSG